MNLKYTKISHNLIKFFYEDGKKYGEFYIRMDGHGNGSLDMKDSEYGHDLIVALAEELMPVVKVPSTKYVTYDCSKKQFMLDRRLEAEDFMP
jgi:hypothetical protein